MIAIVIRRTHDTLRSSSASWPTQPIARGIAVGLSVALLVLSFGVVSRSFAAADDSQDKAAAPDDKLRPASLVRIRLPITGDADRLLERKLERARDRLLAQALQAKDARRPLLVLQIEPSPGAPDAGDGTQFERASALANYVSQIRDVKTVAWVPETIRGHGVLVALACEDLVMAPNAEIGEAGADEEGVVPASTIQKYREIAGDLGLNIDNALAVAMVDPSAEVIRVQSEEGVRFLLRDQLPEYRRDHEIIDEQVLVPAGSLARFTGREGREYGFVKYLAADRADLAKRLDVSPESLEEDD
ncbi:MAG: hypothetical protein AAF961_03435, partial [Planctomycetota bacterium]